MKTIYVKEDTLNEAVAYLNNEITFYGFLSHTKKFLKELLVNPLNADVDEYLKDNGINRKTLILALIEKNIIEKETKIEDKNGSDKFTLSYKIPKRNFERKMRRLYTSLFEIHKINEDIISEDGEGVSMSNGNGASGCNNVLQGGGGQFESGEYVPKVGNVQRRKIYVTEEQAKILQEMGIGDAGDYQYDVPFKFNGGNDPAYDHTNMMAKSFPGKKKKKRQ